MTFQDFEDYPELDYSRSEMAAEGLEAMVKQTNDAENYGS
jgi:hypothetical protein